MKDQFIEKYCDSIQKIEEAKTELLKKVKLQDENDAVQNELLHQYYDLLMKQCDSLLDVMTDISEKEEK